MADEDERPSKRIKYATEYPNVPERYLRVSRLDFSRTVQVTVGKEPKKFIVPTNLLDDSGMLRARMDSGPKEAHELKVHLEHGTSEVFEHYLECKSSTGDAIVLPPKEGRSGVPSHFTRLIRLYVLAHDIRDDGLCTAIHNHLLRVRRNDLAEFGLTPRSISEAYRILAYSFTMRELIADMCLGYLLPAQLEADRNVLPAQFIFDLAKAGLERGLQ